MLLGFSLRSLEIFTTVADTRSMAKAAARLEIALSTVSQQITDLESAIGAQLIDRSVRPIDLTTAGRRFLGHASRILTDVSIARTDMLDFRSDSLPQLRVAIVDGLDVMLTPELIFKVNEVYPQCQLSAQFGTSDENFDALLNRRADLIVVADVQDYHDTLDRYPLLNDPLILVTKPGLIEPGSNRSEIRAQLLAKPFVRYSERLPIGRWIQTHMRRLKMEPPISHELESSRSVFAMLNKIDGWTLTTPVYLLDSPYFCDQLEAHPSPFPMTARTVSLWARRDELADLPMKLAELSRQIIQDACIQQGLQLMPWLTDSFHLLETDTRARGKARVLEPGQIAV